MPYPQDVTLEQRVKPALPENSPARKYLQRTPFEPSCQNPIVPLNSQKAVKDAAQDAAIAQLVEHLIRNEGVVGSNPICGTNDFKCLPIARMVAYPESPQHPAQSPLAAPPSFWRGCGRAWTGAGFLRGLLSVSGGFRLDAVAAAAAIIRHLVNRGARCRMGLRGQERALGKHRHGVAIGQSRPFMGIAIGRQIALLDLAWRDPGLWVRPAGQNCR